TSIVTIPPTPPTRNFFFTAPPPPDTYTLSLHDALPISVERPKSGYARKRVHKFRVPLGINIRVREFEFGRAQQVLFHARPNSNRSEEHTSELQSRGHLVCRLLLEKKKVPEGVMRGVVAQ